MKKFILQLIRRYIVVFVCIAITVALLFIWLLLSSNLFKSSTITMTTAKQSQASFIDACTLALPDELRSVGIGIQALHDKTAVSRHFIDSTNNDDSTPRSTDPSSGCDYSISDGIWLRISVYQPGYGDVSYITNRLFKDFSKEESVSDIEVYKENIRVDDNLFARVSNEGNEDFILKHDDNLVVINFQYDAPKHMRQSVKRLVADNFTHALKEPRAISSIHYDDFPKDIKLLQPCSLLDHQAAANFFSAEVSTRVSESFSSIARSGNILTHDGYVLGMCTRVKMDDRSTEGITLETRQYETDQAASNYLQSQVTKSEVPIKSNGRDYTAYYHAPQKYHGYGYMILQSDSVILTVSYSTKQVPTEDECIDKLNPLIKEVVTRLH